MATLPAWGKVHQYLETTDYHFKGGHFYASPSSRKIIDDEVLGEVMRELKTYLEKSEFLSAVSKKQQAQSDKAREDLELFGDARELVEAFIKAKEVTAKGRGDLLSGGVPPLRLDFRGRSERRIDVQPQQYIYPYWP